MHDGHADARERRHADDRGDDEPISLAPNRDKTHTALTATTALFAGGETLTVTAAGADVPAFTGHVSAPGKITGTGYRGTPEEMAAQAIDSIAGFAYVLAAVKAWLEHGLQLAVVADHVVPGLQL